MAEHNFFGYSGEDLAVDYLRQHGYFVRDVNWRSGHKELDIVAEKEDCLVFVEVKTRRNASYGRAEDAVNQGKIRRIVLAADAYVKCHRLDLPVRYDIITVVGKGEDARIEHIEDAFRSPVWYR